MVEKCAGGAGNNIFNTVTFVEGIEFTNFDQWGAELDQSCKDSTELGGAIHGVEACRDPMHVLMFHVETPVFISAAKFDSSLRSGGLHSHTPDNDAWENEDYSTRVQMVADSLRCTAVDCADDQVHKDIVKLPGHGAFLTHCGGKNSHKR